MKDLLVTGALLLVSVHLTVGQSCTEPDFSGGTYSVVDLAPEWGSVKVSVPSTENANSGWSAIVIFENPLKNDITIDSISGELTGISPDRRALTFTNREHNVDISDRQQFSFTFFIMGADLMEYRNIFTALVGFYETQVEDGSCILDPNPLDPLPTTTTESTTTTTTASTTEETTTTTTTTSTTTTTTTPTTSSTTVGPTPGDCEEITYYISSSGWSVGGVWHFIFGYSTPAQTYNDWTIKVVFSEEVTLMTPYEAVADSNYAGGLVWFLKPMTWNLEAQSGLGATVTATTTADFAPNGVAFICNNGVTPDTNVIPI